MENWFLPVAASPLPPARQVLVLAPHPDDETFTSGGLLAKLAANGNNVQILIYTTDNAGSALS